MMFMNTENYPLSWGNFFWIVNNTLSNIWYDIKDNSPVKKTDPLRMGKLIKKKKFEQISVCKPIFGCL